MKKVNLVIKYNHPIFRLPQKSLSAVTGERKRKKVKHMIPGRQEVSQFSPCRFTNLNFKLKNGKLCPLSFQKCAKTFFFFMNKNYFFFFLQFEMK